MIGVGTNLIVADNTGAKSVRCFCILGHIRRYATVGDVIKVAVKEAQAGGIVKKGQVCNALVVRTKKEIRRIDGSYIRFGDNAVVLLDAARNPIGTRVFGPVARELRDKNYMKVVSLAPEVL